MTFFNDTSFSPSSGLRLAFLVPFFFLFRSFGVVTDSLDGRYDSHDIARADRLARCERGRDGETEGSTHQQQPSDDDRGARQRADEPSRDTRERAHADAILQSTTHGVVRAFLDLVRISTLDIDDRVCALLKVLEPLLLESIGCRSSGATRICNNIR